MIRAGILTETHPGHIIQLMEPRRDTVTNILSGIP